MVFWFAIVVNFLFFKGISDLQRKPEIIISKMSIGILWGRQTEPFNFKLCLDTLPKKLLIADDGCRRTFQGLEVENVSG